jgi:hypothetical protein
MEIVVQLEHALAAAFAGRPAAQEALARKAELESVLADLGLRLVPIHPGTKDADLSTYFRAEGTTVDDPDALAATLRAKQGVQAAYAKPDAALP